MEPFRIGVVPARAREEKKRLLAALQQVFPVAFEPRAADELGDLDGVLVLDGARPAGVSPATPLLVTPRATSVSARGAIAFSRDGGVARALRERSLIEDGAGSGPVPPVEESDATLAAVAGRPVWWRTGEVTVSAFAIEELGASEALREQLRPGRFIGLIPLLHFLHEMCDGPDWGEEPLQASFVVDDPNLHWPSYGFLDYAELIAHASAHRYHAGLAMVPLDGWLVNRRAAALVKANGDRLSLLVHGNDHVAQELARLRTDADAERSVAQALRRVERFERRSGVRVRRVMAPPHGACSEAALRAIFRLGFDAACISRPYPWRENLPAPSPLAGWPAAELVAGGLPILPRHHLDAPRDELVFRALLRQPLILYGHHWDFAHGLDVLAHAAADVNRLGDVRWRPLDEIAAQCHATRRDGDTLVVEMHSRKARLQVPEGVAAVSVCTGDVHGEPLWREVTCDSASSTGAGSSSGHHVEPPAGDICRAPMRKVAGGWASDPLQVHPPARIELSLTADRPLRANALRGLATGPWPITRRVLVESRDRVRPLLGGRATG